VAQKGNWGSLSALHPGKYRALSPLSFCCRPKSAARGVQEPPALGIFVAPATWQKLDLSYQMMGVAPPLIKMEVWLGCRSPQRVKEPPALGIFVAPATWRKLDLSYQMMGVAPPLIKMDV
jgi:hypothetical protein